MSATHVSHPRSPLSPWIALAVFALCSWGFLPNLFGQAETKLLYNGTIYTMTPGSPVAEAVAISGDKIIAVGNFSDVKKTAGDDVALVDLKGKWLLPGLIDSHIHAIKGGERLLTADANDQLMSVDELAKFARESFTSGRGQRGGGLYITGMHSGMWSRTEILDSLFNHHPYDTIPVLLLGTDGHTGWSNSYLLRLAGVDRHFLDSIPEEERAYYASNENLVPTGFIAEDAIKKVSRVLPRSSVTSDSAVMSAITHLNSLGITAWMDPSTGHVDEGPDNEMLSAYQRASSASQLTAHVAALVVANANGDSKKQSETLTEIQKIFSSPNLTIPGFKIFLDGVLEYPTQTAAVSIPYSNSGNRGSLMVEPEKLASFISRADRNEQLVHIHAIGDRAATVGLDAFAKARERNRSHLPHSITHLQIVRPEDHPRFASLNIFPCMQLLWANADVYTLDLVKPYIDSTLYQNHYPANSLVRAGAVLCGASDWPVSSANPFEAISVAETRRGPGGVLIPEEAVSRERMFAAYTINAAKAMRIDHLTGSIAQGKNADLVLVDRDVLRVDADEVALTKVLWTMFGGQVVYKAE